MDLDRNANDSQIKINYKKIALKIHPDKNKYPKSSEAFKKFTKAYNVLSNPDERAYYDRVGHAPGVATRK